MDITTGKAKIIELLDNAYGHGFTDDQELTIPFTLPGEVIEYSCQHFKKNKKYSVKTILKASNERQSPVCKHFGQCGGCMLQHLNSKLYKEFKTHLIRQPLLNYNLNDTVFDGITFIEPKKRRRANMDIIRKPDALLIGFHKYQSHQLIDLQECHTLDPDIMKVIPDLRQALYTCLKHYEKAKVFLTMSDVGLDISLEIQGLSELKESARMLFQEFSKKHNLARFVFRYRKKVDCLWLREQPVVHFANIPIEIDAYSFLQSCSESDIILSNFVLEHLPSDTKNVLDLFCGRGTLTLPLSLKAPVIGFENDKKALQALEKGAQHMPHSITVFERDLFENPLSVDELKPYDVVVIDPPRAGAYSQIMNLAKSCHKKIIYISCNPKTFAKDAAELEKGNYKLTYIKGLDQFIWSPHIEVMAVFELKNSV